MSKAVVASHEPSGATYTSYIAGFVLSVIFTLAAYWSVVHHSFSTWVIVYLIALFAVAQFVVQVTLFLHLGHETKPRFKLLVFGFMLLVVTILVFGSLWIMHNLNYHMLTPAQINTYMQQQDGGI